MDEKPNEAQVTEEVRTKCPTCKHSQQLFYGCPALKIIIRHPAYGCLNADSSKHGFWLTPSASCDLHDLDTEKLEKLLEPPPNIVKAPSAVTRKLKRKIAH